MLPAAPYYRSVADGSCNYYNVEEDDVDEDDDEDEDDEDD